jgi:molecular chaperone GrpE (heat shock protein)
VREQLSSFQNACREIVRRVGLVPYEAKVHDPFDEKTHQLLDAHAQPPSGARIAETIATGYTFQGQFLRPAIVKLETDNADDPAQAQLILPQQQENEASLPGPS